MIIELQWILNHFVATVENKEDYFCRKFFTSANFECWLHNRRREINQKLQALHIQAICQAVRYV